VLLYGEKMYLHFAFFEIVLNLIGFEIVRLSFFGMQKMDDLCTYQLLTNFDKFRGADSI